MWSIFADFSNLLMGGVVSVIAWLRRLVQERLSFAL